MSDADVLVANGAGFEEGLLDVIEAAGASGTPIFHAVDAIETIEFGNGDDHAEDDHADDGHDDHGEDDHADDDHEDHGEDDHAEDDHDHGSVDPHFFTDPARMAVVADAIANFLISNVDGIDAAAVRASADGYISELDALNEEVTSLLAAIPAEDRVLVTNHEVFEYFADAYDFEVAGTVIPSGSAANGASAADLVALTEVVQREQVPAIFTDASSSDELAQTLAGEVGDIAVVELFSESLGDADSGGATYIDMVRTNATKIAEALTS